MAIAWDGNLVTLVDQAPSVLPEVQQALDSGENTYIDFTALEVKSKKSNVMNWLAIGLLGVGFILILRGK